MKARFNNYFLLVINLFFLVCCSFNKDYQKPKIDNIPNEFKQSSLLWKEANPSASLEKGSWWLIYQDEILNDLIDRLNEKNYNIAAAEFSYKSAEELVKQAQSSFLPSVASQFNLTKQKQKINGSNKTEITKTHSAGLSASWELDLWGRVSNSVKSNKSYALASKANINSVRLSMQSSLAQYYFQLRYVDQNLQTLAKIEQAYLNILNYYKNRLKNGLAQHSEVNNADINYQLAKNNIEANKIYRAQYEHAIAVLVGEAPANFQIKINNSYKDREINIPKILPSELLERRPDIDYYEKLVQQANADIGSAKAAFFPSVSLAASPLRQGDGWGNLLNMPNYTWSLGPEISLGIFDAGSKIAQLKYAKNNYQVTIANYKQAVLTAFSEVENQLVSLANLLNQASNQEKITLNSQKILKIAENQFTSGVIDNASLQNSIITKLENDNLLYELIEQKRLAEISLIKALGGGWH